MKSFIKLFTGVLLASAALAFGGHAWAADSGYLGDYSKLEEVTDAKGETVKRYVNPKLKPGMYQAVMIEPFQYYPAPQPSERVNMQTLNDIKNYLDKEFRAKLSQKVVVVSQPGPGVLRIRPAITAVGTEKADLKPYQLIPIAFIVTTAVGRPQMAAINVEVDVADSMTGERMGAAVRQGKGAKMENDNQPVTLTEVSPLLNQWIDTGTAFISQTMK